MANLSLNKVVLAGRLTADVELRQTPSGNSVCSFTIAVNRRMTKDGEREADFITCQAWRKTAEFIACYFGKGSSICITGAIQTRSWEDQNKQKRYATEVLVDEAMFVDAKASASGTAVSGAVPQSANFEELPTDEDIPF